MLTEDNATSPQCARQKQQDTEGENRIIKEQNAKSIQCTHQTSHTNHMGANLPPRINRNTDYLRNQRRHYYPLKNIAVFIFVMIVKHAA